MLRPDPCVSVNGMRIGVIACDALRDEVELLLGEVDGVVHKEYVDFGYHLNPPEMRAVLVGKVNSLAGRVDAVFLGYAHCQALKGLPDEVAVPTVMLECDDCIAALLGPEEYAREKRCGEITWFYPSGWSKYGLDGIVRLFRLDSARDQGYEPDYFLRLMFDGFKRCLFISTGTGDIPKCEANSRQFAAALELRHESAEGTLVSLRSALGRTVALAAAIEAGAAAGPAGEAVDAGEARAR